MSVKDSLEKRINDRHGMSFAGINETMAAVKKMIHDRNTFTASEFEYFAPYYRRNTPDDVRESIGREFNTRVSPFSPIYIVSDDVDENGERKLLQTLPPILNTIRAINTKNVDTLGIISTFNNKTGEINPLNLDAENATETLMKVVAEHIVDTEATVANIKLVDSAEAEIHKSEENTKTKPDTEDQLDDKPSTDFCIDDEDEEISNILMQEHEDEDDEEIDDEDDTSDSFDDDDEYYGEEQ